MTGPVVDPQSEAVFAELEETPDEHGSAPRLSGDQVEELSRVGGTRSKGRAAA